MTADPTDGGAPRAMRIGVISDTHGLLRPEALAALAGVELILHAGDVGKPHVLDALREIAPTVAVRGNVDHGPWASALPMTATVPAGGLTIVMHHILAELALPVPDADVVITGHSHVPKIEEAGGVLYLNPGSAGPRRFALPVSLAMLEITAGRLHARLVMLDVA